MRGSLPTHEGRETLTGFAALMQATGSYLAVDSHLTVGSRLAECVSASHRHGVTMRGKPSNRRESVQPVLREHPPA